MLNKRSVKIIVLVMISVSSIVPRNNLVHAVEETPKQPVVSQPLCPFCKKVHVSPVKEKTLAAKNIVCPDCKSELSALEVHHCDTCGKDVLICAMCQKASAGLKAETMIGTCPKCKKVLSRYVTGKVLTNWKTKCRDCRMKSQEWLIQHCKACDIDFLACPICEKEQERFQK